MPSRIKFLDVSMKFGADGRLKKPFSPADLIRLLRTPGLANQRPAG